MAPPVPRKTRRRLAAVERLDAVGAGLEQEGPRPVAAEVGAQDSSVPMCSVGCIKNQHRIRDLSQGQVVNFHTGGLKLSDRVKLVAA